MRYIVEKKVFYRGPDTPLSKTDSVYEAAKKEFALMHKIERERVFTFAVNDDLVSKAVFFLQSKFNEADLKLEAYSFTLQRDISLADMLDSSFVSYKLVGKDLSEKTIGNTTSTTICAVCGALNEDSGYIPKFRLKGRSACIPLFSAWGMYNIFCREEFITAYKQSGLKGLRFDLIDDNMFIVPDRERKSAWRVRFPDHCWGQCSRVCPECGRHTSYWMSEYWNAGEKFMFDFQLLKLKRDFAYVFSVDAWKFLRQFAPFEMRPEYCVCVIP